MLPNHRNLSNTVYRTEIGLIEKNDKIRNLSNTVYRTEIGLIEKKDKILYNKIFPKNHEPKLVFLSFFRYNRSLKDIIL